MPRVVPFTGQPKESLIITLGGRKLRMRATYRDLDGVWSLDVLDASEATEVPLIQGVSIVMGVDILEPYGLGIGGLFAVPNERPRDEAGRGELGGRVRLVHYNVDELAALEAG